MDAFPGFIKLKENRLVVSLDIDLTTFVLTISAVAVGWLLNNYRDKNRTLGKVIYKITIIADEMRNINDHVNFLATHINLDLSDFRAVEKARFSFCQSLKEPRYDESVILELASVNPFYAYILENNIHSFNESMKLQSTIHDEMLPQEGQIDEMIYYMMYCNSEDNKQRCYKSIMHILRRLTISFGVITYLKFEFKIRRFYPKEKSFLKMVESHLSKLKEQEHAAADPLTIEVP